MTLAANTDPNKFQSTLPSRGATHVNLPQHAGEHISIHAPLAGSDPSRGWRIQL